MKELMGRVSSEVNKRCEMCVCGPDDTGDGTQTIPVRKNKRKMA